MATIVLVHGAWHGSWCWAGVSKRLRERGHDVHAPTLTGLADRAHLLSAGVDHETHVTDIAEYITWAELTGVILCGHSYAGVVITGVADRIPDRMRELIYLDAAVPEPGQSCTECAGGQPAAGTPAEQLTTPAPPATVFGVDHSLSDWIDARMTPMPTAALDGPLFYRPEVVRAFPRTYVLATGWGSNPHLQAAYHHARRATGWTAVAMNASHELMISHPDELAQIIDARTTQRDSNSTEVTAGR